MRVTWDARHFEAGVDRCVFYPIGADPEPWSGIINVDESPSLSGDNIFYREGVRYVNAIAREDFSATIVAFTYPPSFYPYALQVANARAFSLTYRTQTESSYKIHIVYNARAKVSSKSYKYQAADPFSFDITTVPAAVPYAAPSAHVILDASKAYPAAIAAVEDALYGTASAKPYCPTPKQLYDIVEANCTLRIQDNGDGTWTATGPDSLITMLDSTTFQIDANSAVYLDNDTYRISTY